VPRVTSLIAWIGGTRDRLVQSRKRLERFASGSLSRRRVIELDSSNRYHRPGCVSFRRGWKDCPAVHAAGLLDDYPNLIAVV
jgi:hypothetical protein